MPKIIVATTLAAILCIKDEYLCDINALFPFSITTVIEQPQIVNQANRCLMAFPLDGVIVADTLRGCNGVTSGGCGVGWCWGGEMGDVRPAAGRASGGKGI